MVVERATCVQMDISTTRPVLVRRQTVISKQHFRTKTGYKWRNHLFSDCNCDNRGTESEVCEKDNGKCLCKEGYGGARCDQCLAGYYGYPNCKPCNCSTIGSSSIGCDVTGKCSCLANFASKTCDQCKSGYFNYPECTSEHQKSKLLKTKLILY